MKRYLLALSVFLLSISPLLAGTTGKIAGRIKEAGISSPLAGVNVGVACADAAVDYFLLRLIDDAESPTPNSSIPSRKVVP